MNNRHFHSYVLAHMQLVQRTVLNNTANDDYLFSCKAFSENLLNFLTQGGDILFEFDEIHTETQRAILNIDKSGDLQSGELEPRP